MKDVNIFIAEPGNTKAILAVSAIARAMKETNTVVILHCIIYTISIKLISCFVQRVPIICVSYQMPCYYLFCFKSLTK